MKLSDLKVGVSFTRCDECDHKSNTSLRDDLLVTAGARAAYMHDANRITLPEGIVGEKLLASYIAKLVDAYLVLSNETNYDEFIEVSLLKKYGKENDSKMFNDLFMKLNNFAANHNLLIEFDYSNSGQFGFVLYNQSRSWGYKRFISADDVSQFAGTPSQYFDMVVEETYKKLFGHNCI